MSTDAAPTTKYPLINALYDAMVAVFRANTPDDDHIHTSPHGALEEACIEVIGDSPEKFLAIVQEGIDVLMNGEQDMSSSNHTWGMAILEGRPVREEIGSFDEVVEVLFNAAMDEMVQSRNPELFEEAKRKSAEWDVKQTSSSN